VKKHLKPIVQKSAANMIAKQEVDEIETLSANITRLEQKIDTLFSEDSTDPKYIDSLTKLAKEVRESLRYLLEFKGKLVHKRQDTIIVHQMQVIKEVLAQNHPDVWLDVRKQMEEKLQ
jgi:small-conductance mechanosensitive channel